jgi:UDP-N-acetyl-D-mannosaminuronate dehydrogenase
VAALGLSYKPNIDDLRESPAIEFVKLLVNEGVNVKTFEPYMPGFRINEHVSACKSLEEVLIDADIVVLLVAHEQFKNLTIAKIQKFTGKESIIVDAVNLMPNLSGNEYHNLIILGNGHLLPEM